MIHELINDTILTRPETLEENELLKWFMLTPSASLSNAAHMVILLSAHNHRRREDSV